MSMPLSENHSPPSTRKKLDFLVPCGPTSTSALSTLVPPFGANARATAAMNHEVTIAMLIGDGVACRYCSATS